MENSFLKRNSRGTINDIRSKCFCVSLLDNSYLDLRKNFFCVDIIIECQDVFRCIVSAEPGCTCMTMRDQ